MLAQVTIDDPTTLVVAGLIASVPLVVVILAVLIRGYEVDLHLTRIGRRRRRDGDQDGDQ